MMVRPVPDLSDADDPRFAAAAVGAAYDTVSVEYTAAFGDDLARLPVDRGMLDAGLDRLSPGRLALDLGCGPAPVGAYLTAKGVAAIGADLSAGMLAAARTRHPAVALVQANMRHLPFRTGSFGLIVAYYSLHHLPRSALDEILREVSRIVASGGSILLATHLGEGEVYIDELLGRRIDPVGGTLYRRAELLGHLERAGFGVEVERHRGPMPHEADTQRIYLLARRSPAIAGG